ncbi:MAG: protoheme IX farnesyltransferase [Alphaproteobacteria bacterium]|nr:protoheme IX farnesyltransferase [Alphaproteobacteria bacterium]
MASTSIDLNHVSSGAVPSDVSGDGSASPAVADFIALLKPRVMSLVVFTGFAGMMLAPGHLHPLLAAVAILCIAVAAGASGAINMWYDRDIDAGMKRTRNRPLPAGRMDPADALGFGVVLSVAAVSVMGLAVNYVAAALLALTICFYVFVYTIWLKRRTPQNIVIGGASGAFPPMIGWAAVSGDVSLASLALFAIIFMWTPAHFWALSLYRCGDYARVGVPMMPVVAGARETRKLILLYTVLLIPVTLAPCWLGVVGMAYAIVALVLGGGFLGLALRLWAAKSDSAAKALFGYSILYLFLLFAAMLADAAAGMGMAA